MKTFLRAFPSLTHWESHSSLQISAQDGCNLCEQFMQGFDEVAPYFDVDKVDNEGPRLSRGVVRINACFILGWQDFWQLHLLLPYSGPDSESDTRNETTPQCMIFRVNLIPTSEEGQYSLRLLLFSIRLTAS